LPKNGSRISVSRDFDGESTEAEERKSSERKKSLSRTVWLRPLEEKGRASEAAAFTFLLRRFNH